MIPPIAINGKFLAAPVTGVHRVAHEMTHALARWARSDGLDVQLWLPHDVADAAKGFDLPLRVIRPFRHIPWEQMSIPARDRHRVLINLCNIGPILRSNAITMIHDAQVHVTPQSYSRAFRLWYKTLQPLLGRTNRAIATVSAASAIDVARFGICASDRIAVIHNGIDHILKVEANRTIIERLGLRKRQYVVALAATHAHKNIALLARAFASPSLCDIDLVLVGSSSRDELRSAGIDIGDRIICAGRVDDAELRALYEDALALAFPSLTEGFGLPPLEAMRLGTPAIIAPCGALPEVCGDAAIHADPHDAPAWVSAIRLLADSPETWSRWSVRGQDHATPITWDAAAAKLIDLVRNVASSHSQDQRGAAPANGDRSPYQTGRS